jgi:hypothetical protein
MMNKIAALISTQTETHILGNSLTYFTLLSNKGMRGVFCLKLKSNPSLGMTRFKNIENMILSRFPQHSTVQLVDDKIIEDGEFSPLTPDPKTPIEILSNSQLSNYTRRSKSKKYPGLSDDVQILFCIPLTHSVFASYEHAKNIFQSFLCELFSYQDEYDFNFCSEGVSADLISDRLEGGGNKSGLYMMDEWLGSCTHLAGNFLTVTDSKRLATFNVFGGDKKNNNMVLTSSAGGGSSFIINSIFTEHLKNHGKVYSICEGYGYYGFKDLCNYQSNYVELECYSINPLWEIKNDIPITLYSDFVVFVASTQGEVDDVAAANITIALNVVIERKKVHIDIIDVYEQLVVMCKPEIYSLFDLFVKGRLKSLLNGKPTFNFDGQFVALDSEVLQRIPALSSVCMFSFVIQSLANATTNDLKCKSIIHIGEAWTYVMNNERSKSFDVMFERIVSTVSAMDICLFVSAQSIMDFISSKSFSDFYKNANTEISSSQKPEDIIESVKIGLVPIEHKALRLNSRFNKVEGLQKTFICQGTRYGSFNFCYSQAFDKAFPVSPYDLKEKSKGIENLGSVEQWLLSL